MRRRITSTSAIGATVILAFAAATISAQAKPKSSKRIPITKEAAGEVARVDTVVRTDTVVVTNTSYRTDTLYRTITRVDSVMLPPPVVPIRLPNGLYLGIAGGSSMPTGSIYTPNSMGYIGQMQLGWQGAKHVLGGRISTTYTGLGQDSRFSGLQNGHAQLWTFGTDLKLQAPLGHIFGLTPRLAAYGIGGWTYTWYRNLPVLLDSLTNTNLNTNLTAFSTGSNSWTGRNGWDAGGGLSLMWGSSEIFVESRVLGFSPGTVGNDRLNDAQCGCHAAQARQVPLVFGFNWY